MSPAPPPHQRTGPASETLHSARAAWPAPGATVRSPTARHARSNPKTSPPPPVCPPQPPPPAAPRGAYAPASGPANLHPPPAPLPEYPARLPVLPWYPAPPRLHTPLPEPKGPPACLIQSHQTTPAGHFPAQSPPWSGVWVYTADRCPPTPLSSQPAQSPTPRHPSSCPVP